jgi:tetratricopeptide (TPR) repeat protein
MVDEVTPAAALEAARLLIERQRYDQALRTITAAFDPQNPTAWSLRALALLGLEQPEAAREAAEHGLKVDAEDPWLLYVLTIARYKLNDLHGAEESAIRALRLAPTEPLFLAKYAEVVGAAGQFDKCERLVRRALARDPESETALGVHARLAAARGDSRGYLARTRQLLKIAPESSYAHALAADAHDEAADLDRAADHAARAVAISPSTQPAADAAREYRAASHWLLWGLRPLRRIGAARLWLGVVICVLLLGWLRYTRAMVSLVLGWVAICAYSWIAPHIAAYLSRPRRR